VTRDPDECNGVGAELEGGEERNDARYEWMDTFDVRDS